MEEQEIILYYCRFCAERKNKDKLIKFDSQPLLNSEVYRKLSILKLKLYNSVNNHFLLPNTICFVCWSKFNSAFEFHDTFQKAQAILQRFNPKNHNQDKFSSDDELSNQFADLTSFEAKDEDDEPLINLGNHKNEQKNHPSTSNYSKFTVKIEIDDGSESNNIKFHETCNNYNQTPNYNCNGTNSGPDIQEIAIKKSHSDETATDCIEPNVLSNKTDSTTNIGIYAKELQLEPKLHIKKWQDYPWLCLYCSIVLPNIKSLREHTKLEHFKCAAFKCVDCSARRSDNYDFDEFISHVRKHRKLLRKICPYCDMKTDDNKTHEKTHFSNPESVKCHTCGEIFNNTMQYLQHNLLLLTNNNKDEPKLKKKRRKPGQQITQEELTCDVCKKIYKNLNILRDHKRAMHSSETRRVFTCERCGKTFLNKGSLTTHIMGHDKIKPYQCRLCDKGFKFPNLLRRHVDTHSGVKRFKCDECGRGFRLHSQMTKHKIIHTDTMPFVCQYCPKSFRFKSILDIHERQHTGAKPYSCNECGMDFTNWSNYNKHSKRRHGTDLAKKKITPLGSFPVNPLTGKVIDVEDSVACEEWKKQVMLPCKRGPKSGAKK